MTTRMIIFLLFLSINYTIVQVILNTNGEVVSDTSDSLWGFIFAISIAIWAKKEAAIKNYGPPFNFGAFMFFVWPIILPHYLIKTRGSDGIIMYLGFLGIYLMPFLSGLVAYVYLAH
ncbi:hypothetical protein ABT56_01660 [Photobacterium aquae]|uniref:Uncharacterized protein n=1 Tax=Photobacterium aquae TaxID=1195763 RepID=A0A0J1K3E8_9GAMM|nr:hypothetical protein ABT56_01660 [Photobacterium aquae]